MEESICKGCDFYSVLPTLIEGEQQRKPLCGAGKSIEDEVVVSCADYEVKNPLKREEKEKILSAKVRRDSNLPFNNYPVQWQPHGIVDYGYAEPPNLQSINLHIADMEAVKQFLSRDYILQLLNQSPGFSRTEISDRVLRGIRSVLDNEIREAWRMHDVRCNTLILSEEYYYKLLHLAGDVQPRYCYFEDPPLVVERYFRSIGILNLVVARNNTLTLALVFDPLLRE